MNETDQLMNSDRKPKTALCPRKKRDQKRFFCNISYKTQAIVMKFGTPFPE